MAKSQETYSKKEKTKKRIQKRKEKELRRDEKRMTGTGDKVKSLEDMMAYVDEHGNISSTPPDPTKIKKVKAEEIYVSVPKDEDLEPEANPTGIVTYFDSSKGYGFIEDTKTQIRIFVHINNLTEELVKGDTVEYTARKGPRGLQAESVRKIKTPPKA